MLHERISIRTHQWWHCHWVDQQEIVSQAKNRIDQSAFLWSKHISPLFEMRIETINQIKLNEQEEKRNKQRREEKKKRNSHTI